MTLLRAFLVALLALAGLAQAASYKPRWIVDPSVSQPVSVTVTNLAANPPPTLYHWTSVHTLAEWADRIEKSGAPNELQFFTTESAFQTVYANSIAGRGALFMASDPVGGIGSGKIYPERYGAKDGSPEPRVLLQFDLDLARLKTPVVEVKTIGPKGPKESIAALMRYPEKIAALAGAQLVLHSYYDPNGNFNFKEWILLDPTLIHSVSNSATNLELRRRLRGRLSKLKAGDLGGTDVHYNGGVFADAEGLALISDTVERALKVGAAEIPQFFSVLSCQRLLLDL